ncbi:aminopeptidase P family protein [Methanofollis formosanus]|uniref:Aminopeptidase P family protein n=1 Tax=Methanofollis formosanus TaxID=299308 RepID=A0A8G1A2M9_9EURY|nr:Xaa-Pro peptidase family protein [Methanofollis formosanus]QYZ79435.1 aminopeptidase P family protein [Methanofollis formosanus]
MDKLDDALAATECSAYLLYASSADADFRYLTGFQVSDPLLYLKKRGEAGMLVVPQMEYERAATESSAVPVTRAESGFLKFLDEEKDPWRALARTAVSLAGGGRVMVPKAFPYWLGKLLEEQTGVVADEHGVVRSMRAVKTSRELAAIRAAQQATETAMDVGISMIRRSTPKNGVLYFDDAPLTSGRVRTAMHAYLMERGYTARDTIVSCGKETAMPHRQGDGPLLENEPVVIDLFPQHDATGYHADMTRTVVKGEPSPEIAEMHAAVCEAVDLGESLIVAGVEGSAVHNAVVALFKEKGYESENKGFIHSLGHGVGLDVHEGPSLSPSGGPLEAGNVVTVEPGLYYPGIGGVRVENMGAVTQSGFDRFTAYTRDLIL